jgi:hypothetical protein
LLVFVWLADPDAQISGTVTWLVRLRGPYGRTRGATKSKE